MKIIFVSYHYWPPKFGGGLLHTIERLEEMARRGHQVIALTSGDQGYKSSEIINRISIYRSFFKRDRRLIQKIIHRFTYLIWVIRQLLVLDYDIVHIGSLPGFERFSSSMIGILFAQVARLKKARVVYLFSLAEGESEVIDLQGFAGKFRKAFLNCIDDLVVNSPLLYNSLKPLFHHRVKMIVNGAKDHIFIPDNQERDKIRRENNIADNMVVFSSLGSITKRKGMDLLLEAYAEVRQVLPASVLWLIGPYQKDENQNLDPGEVDQLIALAQNSPGVTLWGRIDDRAELAGLLCASDVFVFPTRREGMPMAPLQAMSVGLPIIISRIPGVTDLANIEGETGFYIEPDDKIALTRNMIALGMDKSYREPMGRAARKRVVDDFSWQKHIDQWEALYCGKL